MTFDCIEWTKVYIKNPGQVNTDDEGSSKAIYP